MQQLKQKILKMLDTNFLYGVLVGWIMATIVTAGLALILYPIFFHR